METTLKTGMTVRATPDASFYRTNISAIGAEGVVVAILSNYVNQFDRAIIELTPQSLANISPNYYDYCDTNNIKRELAIISISELEIISEEIKQSNYSYRYAFTGGISSLIAAILFLPIAILLGYITTININHYFFLNSQSVALWQCYIPLILLLITSIFILSFFKGFAVSIPMMLSMKVRNAVIIDMYLYKKPKRSLCEIYCLFENKIVYQYIPFKVFNRNRIGEIIKVKSFGKDDKYIKLYL